MKSVKLILLNLVLLIVVGVIGRMISQHYLQRAFPAGYEFVENSKDGARIDTNEYNLYRNAVPIYNAAWLIGSAIVAQSLFLGMVFTAAFDRKMIH